MSNVEQVKQQAIEAKKVFERFLSECPNGGRDFLAAFHLRPTSSGGTTIVSTLAIAPMRGLSGVTTGKLEAKLVEINKVMDESSDEKRLEVLKIIGFNERSTKSQREEDVQAALIRDIVLRPEMFGGMVFIASEFVLYGYGEKDGKADVLAFKDGILFDIEIKNERLTETVTQAAGYVEHIRKNQSMYADCLMEFPNSDIHAVNNVKGVALVPYSERSVGGLERASKSNNVELWYFDGDGDGYRFFEHGEK